MAQDKELKAMEAVAAALEGVDERDARARVLQWINSRYGNGKPATSLSTGSGPSEDPDPGEFSDLAELFAAAHPSSDPQRALVVGYWFQVHEAKNDYDSQSVNSELKQLGNAVGNITEAFNKLMNRTPQLAIQVAKKGTARQARKRYRLTTPGVAAVKRMIAGQAEEESGES